MSGPSRGGSKTRLLPSYVQGPDSDARASAEKITDVQNSVPFYREVYTCVSITCRDHSASWRPQKCPSQQEPAISKKSCSLDARLPRGWLNIERRDDAGEPSDDYGPQGLFQDHIFRRFSLHRQGVEEEFP